MEKEGNQYRVQNAIEAAIATLLMQWSFPSFCTHTYQVSFQSSVLLPFQKIIMASQVLSSPLGQFSKLENRPVANYHPTIWGDQFISYTPEDEATRACKEKQVEDLKEEI
ncbi:unnamed protein product, partial [Vitis vinifera]